MKTKLLINGKRYSVNLGGAKYLFNWNPENTPDVPDTPDTPDFPGEATEYAFLVNSIHDLFDGDRIIFAYDGDGIDCATGPVTSTSVVRFAGLDVTDLRHDPETIQVSEEMTTFRLELNPSGGYNLFYEDPVNVLNGYITPSYTSNKFNVVDVPDTAWEISFNEETGLVTVVELSDGSSTSSKRIVYNLQNNYFTFAPESSTAKLPKIYKITYSLIP